MRYWREISIQMGCRMKINTRRIRNLRPPKPSYRTAPIFLFETQINPDLYISRLQTNALREPLQCALERGRG